MSHAAGGIPRYRPWSGPALLSAGFRPFFLLAGLWAATALPLWLAMVGGHLALPSLFDPVAWHAREMLFGFIQAAIAGFLLTAVPNWTGRMPLQGWPLGGLALLFVAGRLAVAASGEIGAEKRRRQSCAITSAGWRRHDPGRNWTVRSATS